MLISQPVIDLKGLKTNVNDTIYDAITEKVIITQNPENTCYIC